MNPLVGKQLDSYELSDASGNLWEGAVRSGKTIASIMRWLRFCREGPPGDLLMIGKTERTLKRNVLDPIVGMIGARRCRVTHGAGEANIMGRRIYLAGANDERAGEKIRGMTLAGFYGDELTVWPESVFDIARTRLSVANAKWFGTTNPGAPNHFIKKKHIDRAKMRLRLDGKIERTADPKALDLNVFSFGIDDNPNLPAAFVAQLKREYVGVFHKRFILGQWAMAEGAIFDMFDEDRHVVDEVPDIRRWISCGIDYGTHNPLHAVLVGIGKDRRLYVTSEWRYDSRQRTRQLSDSEYSEELRYWLSHYRIPNGGPLGPRGVMPDYICVDPSAASLRIQLWRDGLGTMAADNSVLDGIRVIGSALANDRLRFLRDGCPELIAELPGYAWDDRAAKLGRDEPVKVDDHGCDGLRYGLNTTVEDWHDEVYELAA